MTTRQSVSLFRCCSRLRAKSGSTLLRKRFNHLAVLGILAAAIAGQSSLQAGTCTINVTANQQTIDGFGFASAWASALTSAQADTFFGTGSGQLGFTLLRCRIDPNRSWSTEAANASAAHARGAKVLGSPWTPPANMKNNGSLICGNLLASQYGNYANHLRDAANTIGLDWVSFQNEPDFCPNPGYESCNPSGTEIANWCANNAPTVGKPIVVPEAVNFNDQWLTPTLNNTTAKNNISIVAGHFYGGGNSVHQNALNAGKHVWMTEHFYNGTDIGTCMTIAKEISDAMNNKFSAYIWWRAYHDTLAGDDLINGSTAMKNGYTIGQFTKWVRPGKQRCSSTYNPTANIFVTAYHNSGLVIVALNTGGSSVSQTFTLQNASGVTTLLVHRTSSSQNMAGIANATVSNNSWTYTLPAQSITTFHQF